MVIRGHPGPRTVAALPGFEVVCRDDECTYLRGRVADQPALQGVIRRLVDLGLMIESLRRIVTPP